MARTLPTIKGCLGRRINPHALPALQTRASADVDDDPEPPLAHVRQDGPHQPVRPEEHSLELGAHLVISDELGGMEEGEGRVVDEHVDGDALGL